MNNLSIVVGKYSGEKRSFLMSRTFIIFATLVLIKPSYMMRFGGIGSFFYATCAILAIVFTLVIIRINLSKRIVWVLLYYTIMLFSTYLNSGDVSLFVKENMFGYTLCMMFSLYMEWDARFFISCFDFAQIYIYLNFVSILLFPHGLYRSGIYAQNWLLGYKNLSMRIIIPLLCVSFIHSVLKYKKIKLYNFFLWIIGVATALLTDTINGLVGILCWGIVLLLLVCVPPISKLLNVFTVSLAHIGFIAFLFFVHIPDFVFRLLDLFDKKKSFLGRYRLWKIVINRIIKKPLLGYGYLAGTNFVEISKLKWATHAHNWILNLLMLGGICLFIVFLWGVMVSASRLKSSSNVLVANIITATIICFFVMGIDEAMTNSTLIYPVLIMGMGVNKFSSSKETIIHEKD